MNKKQDLIDFLESKSILDEETLISITIITLFISLYGKFITFGWTTIVFFPLFLIHYTLFTICGIMFAKRKNKIKADYKYYFALCITLILYAFAFRDFGDVPKTITNEVIKFIDKSVLPIVSATSFCTNIILIFIIIVRLSRKENVKN